MKDIALDRIIQMMMNQYLLKCTEKEQNKTVLEGNQLEEKQEEYSKE